MKNTTKSLILISLLVIFQLVFMFYFNTKFSSFTNNLITAVFWAILCFLFVLILKYPKNKSIYNKNVTKTVIVYLLYTVLVTYLLGLFTGFSRNVISTSLSAILKNTYAIIIIVISKEIIRYIVAKNSELKKYPIIVLTILFIFIEVYSMYFISSVNGFEGFFLFVCKVVIPTIASNILLSYLAYNFSITPCLFFNIPLNIYMYIFPIVPNIGDFIYSVVFMVLPFLIYLQTLHVVRYMNKEKESYKYNYRKLFYIPIVAALIVIVVLVTGIFKYKMIAIVSGSMTPTFDRGDAVIYEKINNINTIKEGNIIAFYKDNKLITHRVKKIEEKNGNIVFYTKGDHYKGLDKYTVDEKDVCGKVKFIVKYIGYPSVWLSETF